MVKKIYKTVVANGRMDHTRNYFPAENCFGIRKGRGDKNKK